jgi:type I restriction enzyme M protein
MTNIGFQTKLMSKDKGDTETCLQEPDKNRELKKLFDRLWEAADELRANSKLRSAQYSTPVLGILFLRYAYHKFEETTRELEKKHAGRDRPTRKLDYQAEGAIYLTEKARYKYLLELPEGASIGKAIDDAMRSIEDENEELRDVLPKVYINMEDSVLINLLKIFNKIPTDLDRDIFGKIYEYFLGKFAMSEGQRGGEFYTPTSIVRLIVEVIEPYHGRILDPACGSGGMFVQSAEFVKDHLKNPYKEISIYGQEKAEDTVRLCKMNLAIHGLSGDIRQGNSYYEDVFNKLGHFDYVMANPPFNVNNVDKDSIKDDPRYPFGLPTVDNANYLWIQIFYSMLNAKGRAGFVMANSASDASRSELEIRKRIVEQGEVDVVISVASKFFYTVPLAVTLWFLDKGKKSTVGRDKVLFIDAGKTYNQIDRAHREFAPQQIEFLSNIVRLYRGQEIETGKCSSSMLKKHFPNLEYRNVVGLCKVVTTKDIKEQDWSLNPGRYVGVKFDTMSSSDLKQALGDKYANLRELNEIAYRLENKINDNLDKLLEGL